MVMGQLLRGTISKEELDVTTFLYTQMLSQLPDKYYRLPPSQRVEIQYDACTVVIPAETEWPWGARCMLTDLTTKCSDTTQAELLPFIDDHWKLVFDALEDTRRQFSGEDITAAIVARIAYLTRPRYLIPELRKACELAEMISEAVKS